MSTTRGRSRNACRLAAFGETGFPEPGFGPTEGGDVRRRWMGIVCRGGIAATGGDSGHSFLTGSRTTNSRNDPVVSGMGREATPQP